MSSQTGSANSVNSTFGRSSSKGSRNSDYQGYYQGWSEETVPPHRWIRHEDLANAMVALGKTCIDVTNTLEALKESVKLAEEALRTLHESACRPPLDFDERLPETDGKTFYILYDGSLNESITRLWAIIAWSLMFINHPEKTIHGICSFGKLWQYYLKQLEAQVIMSKPVYTDREKLEETFRIKWIAHNWLTANSENEDDDEESDYNHYEDTDDNGECGQASEGDGNSLTDENCESNGNERSEGDCKDDENGLPYEDCEDHKNGSSEDSRRENEIRGPRENCEDGGNARYDSIENLEADLEYLKLFTSTIAHFERL